MPFIHRYFFNGQKYEFEIIFSKGNGIMNDDISRIEVEHLLLVVYHPIFHHVFGDTVYDTIVCFIDITSSGEQAL
jgi:hypothetical protein